MINIAPIKKHDADFELIKQKKNFKHALSKLIKLLEFYKRTDKIPVPQPLPSCELTSLDQLKFIINLADFGLEEIKKPATKEQKQIVQAVCKLCHSILLVMRWSDKSMIKLDLVQLIAYFSIILLYFNKIWHNYLKTNKDQFSLTCYKAVVEEEFEQNFIAAKSEKAREKLKKKKRADLLPEVFSNRFDIILFTLTE